MARQFREKWIAGTFIQQNTNVPSSLVALNVASQSTLRDVAAVGATSLAALTPSSFTGAAGWRGIAILSGATVSTSVQASAAQSGAAIFLQVYNYLSAVESFTGLQVQSVGTGFFNVKATNSIAPTTVCYFAWEVVR